MSGSLLAWSTVEAARFGSEPMTARHRLPVSRLFGDEALADLLDAMPTHLLHVYTMGDDPADPSQWQAVRHGRVPGTHLLDAVRRGRLWLNLLRVHRVDRRLAGLVDRLYAELTRTVPGFVPIATSATLLISSPGAMVHYHADGQPNLLWHLRGRKKVWVYPAMHRLFLSTRDLQRIFTGEADEFVPYRPQWDEHATVLELEPGDVASWPQNAPHRVVNTDGLNVSLSTEHRTRASTRREHVWAANRMLSARFHLPVSSTKESGAWAAAKANSYRMLRRVAPPAGRGRQPTLVFRMDPSTPTGYTLVPG